MQNVDIQFYKNENINEKEVAICLNHGEWVTEKWDNLSNSQKTILLALVQPTRFQVNVKGFDDFLKG